MRSKHLNSIPQLDHLRGFAAVLVLAFHVYHYVYQKWQPNIEAPWLGLIIEGHTGVGLFFCLSGFLFMLISLNNEGEIRYSRFIYNRILRIAPLFVFIFIIAISLNRDKFQPIDFFYLIFSNIGQASTSNYFITGAAWTIGVEIMFYAVFPLIAREVKSRGALYLIGILLVLWPFKISAWIIADNPTHLLYSTLIGRFDQFIIGMLAACLWFKHRDLFIYSKRFHFIISVMMLLIAMGYLSTYASSFSTNRHQLTWLFWSGIEATIWSSVIISYLSLQFQYQRRLMKVIDIILSYIGKISYSIYLLHACVLFLVFELIGELTYFESFAANYTVYFLAVFLLTTILSTISYEVIERPFLSKKISYIEK